MRQEKHFLRRDQKELTNRKELFNEDFKNKLEVVYKKMFPDGFEAKTIEEQKVNQEKLIARENAVKNKEVKEAMQEYEISSVEINELENGLYEMSVLNHFSDKQLPEGYSYKGELQGLCC